MINYEQDSNGIVTLTIDMLDQAVNTMNSAFQTALNDTITRLEREVDGIRGVILTSGKSTFFAGGDLRELIQIGPEHAQVCIDTSKLNKAKMRRLEMLGKPVVVAINGTALGGGLELALCGHHRICIDSPKTKLGFPEVTLGLLPGAGGVVRTVRMMGLQKAMPYLLEGKQVSPKEALEAGLVDALASDREDMLRQAYAWIQANPQAKQPWDVDGYKLPGGLPSSPKMLTTIVMAPAALREKTRGNYPAPEAILAAMVEGAEVDFDDALTIEGRYFTQLATGQVAKNMIGTLFFQMQEINSGKSRPKDVPRGKVASVGVLGAGMMGAGIAAVSAERGISVVLKDVTLEKAESGKNHFAARLEKRVKQGRLTADRAAAHLSKIKPTAQAGDLVGCDLIVEAVFENRELKAQVTREAAPYLSAGGIMASNTSTLPITGLADAFPAPERFIGLHFFSPVDKMQLVEIIKGAKTSDETLARAIDYVQQIGKLPIVVNDSRGFFTSRVFGTFVSEGLAMLAEGLLPSLIENAALSVGMPVGPLAVQDEVSLSLSLQVTKQNIADLKAEGITLPEHPAAAVIESMVNEHKRCGRAAGAGFYEYPKDPSVNGGKKYLWPELKTLFVKPEVSVPYEDVRDRFLYIQAIETIRCLEENVLESVRDANIGSIFGIGFPAWTGGAIQFVNHVTVRKFVDRAEELRQRYGDRFAAPSLLLKHLQSGIPL